MKNVEGVKYLGWLHSKVGKRRKDSIPKNVQLVYTHYLKKYGKLNEVEKYEKYLQENDVPRNALQQFKNLKESI